MVAHINIEAARATLREITSDAVRVSSMARMAFDSHGDATELDAYCTAMEVLAQRMGWLAEQASELLGERVPVVGRDARDWLLPQHCKAKKVEG